MITLPETSPRAAHVRSGGRLLVWVARQQRGNMIVAAALGVIWMLGEAVIPVIVGRTIDAGILERDSGALLIGCAVLLTTGVLTALVGVMLHRFSVLAWLKSALLVQRLIGYHLANHGVAVTADTTSGEVAESVGSDASRMGNLFETSSRSLGALVSFPLVAAFVIHLDPVAGLWVAAGLPLTSIALFVVVRPLQSRERLQRKATGRLTALGADTAAGLRVLRGIGGERQFVARYRQRSQEVKAAGLRVARAWGMVEVVRVVVPGLFVVVLIWFGARGVLDGRLSAGELVTLYGSAAYLRIPLDVAGETLFDWISARVASERVAALLSRRTAEVPESQLTSMPGPGAGLADPVSGVRLPAGALTALVSDRPEQADALGERLAGLGHAHGLSEVVPASGPALGGIPLVRLPQDALRSRVQLNEAEPRLFSGTLRSQLDPYERHPDDVLIRALVAADALDVLQALPDGLDTELEERGRGFSGGQRQRLALARALVLDPEVLLLLEPTSAVDAHTEARMAQRLRAARQGRTTLVTTASPLLLQECDQVLFLHAKQVVATGTHRQLMRSNPSYRAVVTRDVQEDDQEEV